MKKIVLLSSLVLFSGIINAQDQLYKRDNSKLLVKVIEISPDEIKYKLFDNQNGTIYSESKANVSLIIYQDGTHETFATAPLVHQETPQTAPQNIYNAFGMSKADSLLYYSYSNNISINFLNFFNNEIGVLYQKEFFKSQFNIQIPVAFGVETPNITQSVYFGRPGDNGYQLHKKLFDVGFGINYYPTLTSDINYYIGPLFRYMQYDGTQSYSYQTQVPSSPYQSYSYKTITSGSTLSRYTMGITNGVILRTRSRLTAQAYASIGFKNDVISDREKIKDPVTNNTIEPIKRSVTFYFYCGFNVGFNF